MFQNSQFLVYASVGNRICVFQLNVAISLGISLACKISVCPDTFFEPHIIIGHYRTYDLENNFVRLSVYI